MSNSWYFAIAGSAILLSSASIGHAAGIIALDTLGPENNYNVVEGVGIGSVGIPGYNYSQANRFTSSASGSLYEITAAMSRWAGSDQITFNLFADANGAVGTLLASTSSTLPIGYTVISTTFSGTVSMLAGTSYWLGISTADATASVGWQNNVLGLVGVRGTFGTIQLPPGQWAYNPSTLQAARLTVQSPVPEPTTGGLLLVGGSVLFAACASKRTYRLSSQT